MSSSENPFVEKSPIPNARRIVTYDDRGEPIDIEWQLLDSPPVIAGKVGPAEEKKQTGQDRKDRAA